MHVEAKDRKHPSLICAATITEVRNRRLLIHFDGWPDKYNYWCSPDTTDIHPPMWCGKNGKKVQPPYGMCCRFTGGLMVNFHLHIVYTVYAYILSSSTLQY